MIVRDGTWNFWIFFFLFLFSFSLQTRGVIVSSIGKLGQRSCEDCKLANSFKGRMLHLERSLEDRNIKVNVTPRFLNPPLPAKLVNSIKRSVERRSLVYFSEYGISREYYFTLRHFRNDGGSSIMIMTVRFDLKDRSRGPLKIASTFLLELRNLVREI